MDKNISLQDLARYDASFNANRVNKIAMNAAIYNGVKPASKSWQAPSSANFEFSVKLDNRGITNQKGSGRCWMFAALNCLRYKVIHDLNLENFELSQNYTVFYDKLEKANYFYESILKTLDEPVGGRLVTHLLKSPLQDGGQWDMMVGIMEKYGVVPKIAMPESACSSGTSEMNGILTEKLRGDAAKLRAAHAEGKCPTCLREMKKEMLNEVYRVLCICLGTPPEKFDFEVRTKDGKYIADRGLTPKEFYDKYVGVQLHDYVSVINAPTADKPYMRSFTVGYLGNVVGGTQVRYVNLPIEELKKAAIAQMQDGEPVWFGCDVGKYSDRDSGLLDLDIQNYNAFFSIDLNMDKADRLNHGHSLMTHAMVFQGVNLDEDGKPTRWLVENSWGDTPGNKGMYLMTDEWFNEYMYQIVVHKKYLSDEVIAAYESDPIVLAPWDPMGSLA